jgi:hypothetical protein
VGPDSRWWMRIRASTVAARTPGRNSLMRGS